MVIRLVLMDTAIKDDTSIVIFNYYVLKIGGKTTVRILILKFILQGMTKSWMTKSITVFIIFYSIRKL